MRDPEGLLSTFPAIANTLFGVAAGEWIRQLRTDSAKLLRRLVAAGLVCFVAGELWGRIFPINKKLWTSSYVLLTVGLAMLALAACYWLLDVKKLRGRWTVVPTVFGTNCIFAYAFSEFVATASVAFKFRFYGNLINSENLFRSRTFDHIPQPQLSALGYALFYTALCWTAPGSSTAAESSLRSKVRCDSKGRCDVALPGAPPSPTACFAVKVGLLTLPLLLRLLLLLPVLFLLLFL